MRGKGTIYYDNSVKGDGPNRFKSCWRAEITIDKQRYRHRSKDRIDCEEWLKAVRLGRIDPTNNKADWMRMEQRKDENIRIDEIITSAAEESTLMYEYRRTKNLDNINEYIIKRLLPHLTYYCAHSLRLGKENTITASKQSIALLLTRIVGGRPVTNFTFTCKRMLRLYKSKGNFFYYEKAPKNVELMVNRIDFSPLKELWKVTKDKRI